MSLEARDLAQKLLALCQERGIMIATAESCTGGMIASSITDIAGSSVMFDRGFVTYSNDAKVDLLGVPRHLIITHGAVSGEVVRAMAEGALTRSSAGLAIGVTGVAGPSGGSREKPVGLVWFGIAVAGKSYAEMCNFAGDRAAIREAATVHGLNLLLDAPV